MEDILTQLVPSLVERGAFGAGHYVSLKADDTSNGDLYSTEITMLKLKLKVNTCDTKTVPIVVKSQFPDERFRRRRRDSASMFRNEVSMYNSILPFLNPADHLPYPRAYYGLATGGEDFEKDVLIIENLRYSGFTQCKDKLFLDFNHLAVAIRRLAELHSWSFIEKTRNKKKFFELVGNLEKVVRVRGDEDFDFDKMNYLSLKRGIDPLIKTENYVKILNDFLKIAKNIQKLNSTLCKVTEPFGVVVHGDYSKTNILFKYDYKGRPTDCSYLDFQLSKYASPVLDVSFFLYLHTTPEIRHTHWETFLRIYWNSVREYVPDSIELPCYEDFEEHFASKAVYGYLVCSFYLPNILEDNVITNREFTRLSLNGKLERFVNSAGEKGQMCISDIVSHMLRHEYIHRFMKNYDK